MATEATEPPEPRLFVVDQRAANTDRDTRLYAALVAACGGVWLFSVGKGAVASAFALAGVAFAMIWTMGWIRKRVNEFDVDNRYLQLTAEGLERSDGRIVMCMSWDELRSISIDEDRLQVCLEVEDGQELRLDDDYVGTTPHDLAKIIHEFHQQSNLCTPSGDG